MSTNPEKILRILLVCPERFDHRGGVSRIVERLLQGLPAAMRLSLACPGGSIDGLVSDAAARLERVLPIPAGRWSHGDVRQFAAAIVRDGCDLVHVHDGGTFGYDLPAPWRCPLHRLPGRVPWIYSNHCVNQFDYFIDPADPAPRRILKRIVAWGSKALALTRTAAEVLDSRENEARLRAWFPFAGGRLRTIYHSGLTGRPPGPVFRDPALTIGNLGHIGRRKGQCDLLEAFRLLRRTRPGLKLILMGDDGAGTDAAELRATIAREGLSPWVLMPGGSPDTSEFWRAVDVYVQPSHYEGMPMALVEALWNGKPCVATRVSGIPEVLDDGMEGLLCDPHRPDQLAAAIGRLLDDAALRERLGRSAQRAVESRGLTRDHMIAAHVRLYREVTAC